MDAPGGGEANQPGCKGWTYLGMGAAGGWGNAVGVGEEQGWGLDWAFTPPAASGVAQGLHMTFLFLPHPQLFDPGTVPWGTFPHHHCVCPGGQSLLACCFPSLPKSWG